MTLVLVALRYLFLLFLYLFLLQVIRLVVKDLREIEAARGSGVAWLRSQPCLVVVSPGREKGAVFPLGDYVSIGRDPTNNIVLSEPAVSARHAIIVRRGRDFWLRDAGSTNGTYVNGEPVTGLTRLRPRDKLTLGETTLQFMG